MIRGWQIAAIAAATALGCHAAAAQQQTERPAAACGGDVIARGKVGRVIDGSTLALDDGHEVRLAGIEVPPLASPPSGAVPAGDAAKDAVTALMSGAQVVLRRAEFLTDRYGRTMAYVYAAAGSTERLVQAELLSAGAARVGDRVGGRNCASDLFGREKAAREAKIGLWGDPYYAVLHADDPAGVLAQRGRFALVEGSVVSVHESGATLYVNFGRRWSEEFAVTIRKRSARSFKAAGVDVAALAGRRVLVRGYVERRGGAEGIPWIEATRPEQIEPADHE